MTWDKPAAELVARFDACLPPAPGVDRRQMFGCPCAFVNGQMFAGLHEQNLILRLPEATRQRLAAEGRAGPFTVLGRTMREYVAIPQAIGRPAEELVALIAQAHAFAAALPAKVARRRASAAKPPDKARSTRR